MRPPSALIEGRLPWILLSCGAAALTFLGGYTLGSVRERAISPQITSSTKPQIEPTPPNGASHIASMVPEPGTEYMLAFESDSRRKQLQKRIDSKINESIAFRGKQFEQALIDLGISEEDTSRAMTHAWKVARASIEVEAMQQQYLKAKLDYDKRMHRLLSEEQYAKYRLFEESKKFQFEYRSFQKFTTKQGLPDFTALRNEIQGAIHEAEAYTMSFSHGPYDAMPQVGIGRQTALARLKKDIEQLAMSAAKIESTPSGQKLPPECLKALNEYYSFCLDHMKEREAKLEAELSSTIAPI